MNERAHDFAARYGLRGPDLEAFMRAVETGYVVARGDMIARESALASAWWRWCERESWPYVRIAPRQRYARLVLDVWPDMGSEQVERLREGLLPFIMGLKGGSFSYGPSGAYIDRVRREDAEAVARWLLDIARTP